MFKLCLILLPAFLIAGCATNSKKLMKRSYENIEADQIDACAKEILAEMTLKEKVNEMCGKGVARTAFAMFLKGHTLPVYAGGSKKHGLIPISFTDGPRGVSVAVSTNFPTTMARGASWDADLEKRIGIAMGKEARAAGSNYSGAVCINLLRHPAWGRSQETYGEDTWLLGELGTSLTTGIQQHNVMACIKHYALNSLENSRFLIDVNADERTLREVYLPHFKKCIDAGAASVMSAYNQFRGEYCGHNKYLLTDILRYEWGFRGFITSDWFWGLRNTEKGIKAGMNIEMPNGKYYAYKKVKRALEENKITEKDIDNLVFSIVRTKLEWQQRKDAMLYSKTLIASAEHIALAKEAAEKSAVLLKNENVFLPLQKGNVKKIAVVGSLAKYSNDGDNGSSKVKSKYVVTPFDGLKNYLGNDVELLFAKENDLEKIKQISKEADAVIIVAGFNKHEEGEYIHLKGSRTEKGKDPILTRLGMMSKGDRLSLELHERDLKVIEAVTSVTNKAVVCIASGSTVIMESWKNKVAAIMLTFYNGMEGGNALARLLFGEVNPSGKLPFTVPVNEKDLPHFDAYADSITYGYYHGYTLFDKTQKPVAFPFGFGLSYTTFQYSNLNVLTPAVASQNGILKVSVDITNTGNKAGEEVAQLYIGFSHSKIDRPVKLLRGFKKMLLHPNETKTISFAVKAEDISYYDAETKTWKTEKMTHEIFVGKSSDESDLLKAVFEIQ
jgi:beta-glucosidase